MSVRALDVYVGRVARERIAAEGWNPALFSLLLGASGGPKWLVLSQLDRVLFGDFLAGREEPLHILGTSIGSWRHACLAQVDPVAAIGRMEEHYIHQEYRTKPSAQEVTEKSRHILDQILGTGGAQQIVSNTRYLTHIGTVRGRGFLASQHSVMQGAGLTLAALSNAVSRRFLQMWYQRVVFSSWEDALAAGMHFADFATAHVPLTEENVASALMASASIPLVLEGVPQPVGAPSGLYWDGGVVDYHHDLGAYEGDGLILYPHFYGYVIPGWLDKSFKGRRACGEMLERAVILAPSDAFVRDLPGSKIPDRKDFQQLGTEARWERWWEVVRRCEALAEELQSLLAQADPLEGTLPMP